MIGVSRRRIKMEENKKDVTVAQEGAREYSESDFIADLGYVSKFYTVTVIISALMILAAIFIAVNIKVSTGLICGMVAVLYYIATVTHILKKKLGIAYTSTTGQLRITGVFGKGREEIWIPRRLLWLDVTELEDKAFCHECSKNIKVVHLPATLTRIGKNAFDGCESLERILYEGSIEQWEEIELECELGEIKVEFSDKIKYPDKFMEREKRRAERASKKADISPDAPNDTDAGDGTE